MFFFILSMSCPVLTFYAGVFPYTSLSTYPAPESILVYKPRGKAFCHVTEPAKLSE